MSEHTPAPWILDEHGHIYAEAFYRPAPFTDVDGVEHPDHMAGLVALPYAPDVKDGNARANALLMHAAPEMLASLSEIVAEWGCPNTPKWLRAKAAIAKAEGK